MRTKNKNLRVAIITDSLAKAMDHKPLADLGHRVDIYFTSDNELSFAKKYGCAEGMSINRFVGVPEADAFIVHGDMDILEQLPRRTTIFVTDDYFKADSARMRGYDARESVEDRLR